MSQRQQPYGGQQRQYKSSREVRQFERVLGGYFDDMGFYNLPDGSFYDPDGYYFNVQGFDEFGGYYDERGYYHPGEGNKHEFQDFEEDEEEDELVKQYERGHEEDDDVDLGVEEQLYREFLKKKDEFEVDEDELADIEPEAQKQEKLAARGSVGTEKKLEERKRQERKLYQEEEKQSWRNQKVDQDKEFSKMDRVKEGINVVGSKAKKENLEAKIKHHIPVGGSPHKVSDLKEQPVKELAFVKQPQLEVLAPNTLQNETAKKAATGKGTKQETKKPAQGDKASDPKKVAKVERSNNEDWSQLKFF